MVPGGRLRGALVAVWLILVTAALYGFFFHRELLQAELRDVSSASFVAGAGVYLLFGCIRGFTLIPVTALIVAALPFFPSGILYGLTIAGILVSSATVYWFAEALHLDELLARRHERRMRNLEAALRRYELPVIVGWSFFPFVPTDLVCYVSGVLGVRIQSVLLGVGLGEGAICAIYIFLGEGALRLFGFRG